MTEPGQIVPRAYIFLFQQHCGAGGESPTQAQQEQTMTIRIGDEATAFSTETTEAPCTSISG